MPVDSRCFARICNTWIKKISNQLTKPLTKKPLIDKISIRLLRKEFRSDMIRSKIIKYIVKKIILDYEWSGLVLLKQCSNK